MHPRHRIDIGPRDLAYGVFACARRGSGKRLAASVERLVSPPDDALACLSVRSGFDLLLGELSFPRGSEVLVSAITHPDMVGILELHGLRPVPVDLDLETLAPRLDLVESAVTPETKAILFAPLFGTVIDLEPYVDVGRRNGLLLIEDCAQSLRERSLRPDPHADVSMFSFGAIKTCSALNGAVLRVKDPDLLARMRRTLAGWPAQPTAEFLRRVLKFSGLSVLANPVLFGAFAGALQRGGRGLDSVLSAFVRGFNVPYDDPAFTARIRRRPSAAVLRLVHRRLARFDEERLARRAALGDRLASSLPATFLHPGRSSAIRTHWVFPVVAADPHALISALRRRGLDAAPAHATSAIIVVPTPPDRPELDPAAARWLLEHVVFLPAYPELPERAVRRLVETVREAAATAEPVSFPARPLPAGALAS
jgi:perosamine synthetase